MKKLISTSIVAIVFFFMLSSCQKKLKTISQREAEQIQGVLSSKTDAGIAQGGKSKAEKEWHKLYKICGQNFTFQDPNYLGLSNNKGIGLIIDKTSGAILRFSPDFNQEDSMKIISVGSVVPICTETINKSLDINLLFNAVFQTVAVDSLGSSFSRAVSKNITAGNWYQVDAAQDTYYEYVSDRPALAAYKQSMEKDDSYVVTSAIYVSNFSADLNYDTNASIGINLKVDSVYNTKILSGSGLMQIVYNGNKKISIRCINTFVPLVVLSKLK